MKRKLTFAMLLSLSAASPLVLALGLGEAEVNSTLSSPLRASIPLTDSAGLQADLLNVSVADDGAFAAAGLPRTPLAASVKMDVTRRQGRLMLDLTTERAVREPWIDLLLRFDWPGGQQLREVTLLLDPPDYDRLPALVSGSPRATREATAIPRSSASSPEPASRAVARTSVAAGSGDPAWVRSGDTLWAVAGRLRPDSGISINQMMLALVEANPQVFSSGNINAMRAGFTLVVPSRDVIAARTSAEADRLVQAMNQAWANRGNGAPARVPLGATAPVSAVASTEDQEVAPVGSPDAASSEPATAEVASEREVPGEPGQRLTLLSDAEVATEEGLSSAESLSVVQGEASSAPAEDGQGTFLSLALAPGTGGEGPFIDPEVLASIQGAGELTEDERLLRLEERSLDNREVLEAVRNERDELQTELGDLREELDALRDQLASLTAGGSGVDAAGTGGVVAPGSQPPPTQQTPWWGALYQGAIDRNLMLGGAGLAALLALWALLRSRRRREQAPAPVFNEAQPLDPTASGVVMPDAVGTTERADVRDEGQKSSVRASMPEAEAINEADIFIAYGRYDQARELLESSLAREPGRDDLRLKLLRVQLEQGDHAAAERQAEQLRDGDDPDIQAEVAQLMTRHQKRSSTTDAEPPTGSEKPPEGPAHPLPERAVFPVADELPPRRFDLHEDLHEDPDETSDGGASDSDREPSREYPSDRLSADPAPKATPDAPSIDDEPSVPPPGYRPPEPESGPETPDDVRPEPPLDSGRDGPPQAKPMEPSREDSAGGQSDEPTPQAVDGEPSIDDELSDPLAGYRPPELDSPPESPADARPDPLGGPSDEPTPQAVDGEPSIDDEPSGPLEGYRPPDIESGPDSPADPLAAPGPEDETPPESAADEPSRSAHETTQSEDGSNFIDYLPPALEEKSAPREETPMQPSVDFTPSETGDAGDTADAGETTPASRFRSGRDVPEDWDVEEVAFPPLSGDNAHFSAAASSTSTLAEARRLLDAGESGQARALLESLIDESNDPDVRREAREWLDQHSP
ncbi:FimV/HubP family polar landmark protein [Halomonas aquatica]|uniref:FimV/HubP family polar landmark protein n=1 Tax=Halomonas aquatica TaxID=3151123 RepID=A0ABV1NFN9_9GAMM